jgi:hypothetical protein
MRCLNRRLSDIVFRTMLDDSVSTVVANEKTGPPRAGLGSTALLVSRWSA